MHDHHNSLVLKRIRRASEIARKKAFLRWELERKRRDAIAAKDPAFTGLKIARRIIVIDGESVVREAVIYEGDSVRLARKKLRAVLTAAATV
jgi:hypothetical protein